MTIATKENTTMASLPTLSDGIALTHFIVAEDVEQECLREGRCADLVHGVRE
jgi:hypothetical protein